MSATFLDFDLRLEQAASDYHVRVLRSPAGEASAAFVVTQADIEGAGWPERAGGRLFAALFHDEVLSTLRRSLDEARRQGAGLRIRLRLDDVPELATQPWESLYDRATGRFLALSAATPIVRYLELPEPPHPLIVRLPLRVLAVIAGPHDYPRLDVEHEWQQLSSALDEARQSRLVQVERLERPTAEALQERLRQEEVHVLHFTGHGEWDGPAGSGALILEHASGEGMLVAAQALAALLADAPALRLCILNACDGARATAEHPLGGVAQRLVRHGVPAVVAMGTAIRDDTAVEFTRGIYRALAAGVPVDAAVAEARKAIFAAGGPTEWTVPILFMRSPDGLLWRRADQEEQIMEHDEEARVPRAGGDVISAHIGPGARGVAVGKHIVQSYVEGTAETDPRRVIEEHLDAALTALRDGAVDPQTRNMAEFQLKLLRAELGKTAPDEVPSASTITQVGDWLLENVPRLAMPLRALFTSQAAALALGKAGEAAVAWATRQFG